MAITLTTMKVAATGGAAVAVGAGIGILAAGIGVFFAVRALTGKNDER